MASTFTYVISGDHETGKGLVASSLEQQGFRISSTPNGGFNAERGNMTKTLLLGALSGKDFHVSFIVGFAADERGSLVATLHRNLGSGAVKGGALGASKVNSTFTAVAEQVRADLQQRGVLLHVSQAG